jgi:hypothetical protein
VLLAADPEADTHRAFGVPAGVIVEDEAATSWPQSVTMGQFQKAKVNPTGELPEALPEPEAAAELNRREGFQPTEIDRQIEATHGTQLAGHFLMDREGIIRWRQIEAAERIDDIGKFPSDEEILRAARSL